MIISSWNVNSVRARIENIINYLKKFSPDIVMIQEIKTEDQNFPYADFKKIKYESHVFGQKSYNGVAILSKKKIQNVKTGLTNDKLKQSRIISGEISFKKKNIDGLLKCTNLSSISLYGYKEIRDLNPLSKCINLTNLEMSNPSRWDKDNSYQIEVLPKGISEIPNLTSLNISFSYALENADGLVN